MGRVALVTGGTRGIGAAISKATVAPIFTVSHTKTPTAETAGDRRVIRLVMPRANNAPGTTAVTAPYNADHACS